MRTPTPALTDVLLVEDNPGDVRLIREVLEMVSDEIQLETVPDGAEAIDYLTDRRGDEDRLPDLILLDLHTPRMDGFEVLETLKEDPELAALPVIVLTSSDAEADVSQSYDLCANAYLTKPNTHDEFVALARAIDGFWVETAQLPSVQTA